MGYVIMNWFPEGFVGWQILSSYSWNYIKKGIRGPQQLAKFPASLLHQYPFVIVCLIAPWE